MVDNFQKCPYLTNQRKSPVDTESAFSSLVTRNLTHSQSIRLGFGFEKALTRHIEDLTYYKNIKVANTKGKKEFDFLFEDEVKKEIIYAEIKTNLNLDTEKRIATTVKCQKNALKLREEYPDHKIKWILLGARH